MQYGVFPCKIHAKKLACKFLHELDHADLLHANLRVFLRWLNLLVKIHASYKCVLPYNRKYGWWHCGKMSFCVEKKTTYYTLFLTTNVMFCKSTNSLAVGWSGVSNYNTLFKMLTWMHVTCHADCCFEIRSMFWSSVHCFYRLAIDALKTWFKLKIIEKWSEGKQKIT